MNIVSGDRVELALLFDKLANIFSIDILTVFRDPLYYRTTILE
jgi:hypothetical protein